MSRKESIFYWCFLLAAFVFGLHHYNTLCDQQIDILTVVRGIQDELIIEAAENDLTDEQAASAGYVITSEDLGEFSITYYCGDCAKCGTNGVTASGRVATAGRTCAVDPSIIPLGSVLEINGHYYVAEDTGGKIKGHRIDICVADHEEALRLGTDTFRVYLTALEPVY